MRTIRVLILEDDLETLSVIMSTLKRLEKNLLASPNKADIAVTVFSEYTQVEDYLNKLEKPNFDVILLDRDCKLGGSFHTLDFEKFDVDKVVGISSVPAYNENLRGLGVTKIVGKDYMRLDRFAEELLETLTELFE